jgi:carboxypeptidase family protein
MAPLLRAVEVREGEDLDLGTLRMDPGRAVKGRVLDAETSAPVPGARVTLTPMPVDSQEPLKYQGTVLTKQDGTFELSQVEARPLTLVVEDAGDHFPQRQVLAPEAGEVTVRLEAGASVEVTVQDAQGGPRRASLLFSGDRSVMRQVDVEGHSVIRGLAPGDYTVGPSPYSRADSAALRPQRVQVPPSGHVALVFVESPDAGTVRLHVRDASARNLTLVPGGAPPLTSANALGPLLVTGLRPAWEPTDQAVFHAVPPGRATLVLLSNGTPSRVHVEELEVPATGTLTRDVYPVWRELPEK